MKKIVAVIVTYNRLELLQQAVESVRKQTTPVYKLLVVNNGSTDNTADWLAHQSDIKVEYLEKNMGASGGFYHGIKCAVSYGTEWIWVMDDDTICQCDTLHNLLKGLDIIGDPIGFVGSRCIWTDGTPHYMNVPSIKPHFLNNKPFNLYDQFGLLLTESNSWVSLLVNTGAVKAVGLPYKEFYYWSDDLEYTQRITRAGYLGFYSMESVVHHKTAINYCPDFYREKPENLWKYSYGFRNEFFLKKLNNGFLYYLAWLPIKVCYTSYKVFRIRKDNQRKFIATLINSAWNSLFFNPRIDNL